MSTNFLLGIILFILACLIMAIRKAYYEVPAAELKKRRALGEDTSPAIMESLAYGNALRTLLWLLLVVAVSLSVVFVSRSSSFWLGFLLISLMLYYLFSFLPGSRVSKIDHRLARASAPGLNWLLKRAAMQLNKLSRPLEKHYVISQTSIYDTKDLLALIKALGRSKMHRIEPELLVSLERSFILDERRVSDLMTPAKKVKELLKGDVIGPILINELHESPEGIAVVREEPKGDIVGTLSITDLGIKSQGVVGSHMTRELYYLSADVPSLSVVKAFYQTKSNFFIVLDHQGKFVGVINLDKVLKQLTGPLTSFEQSDYSYPEVVAKTDEEVIEYISEHENTK